MGAGLKGGGWNGVCRTEIRCVLYLCCSWEGQQGHPLLRTSGVSKKLGGKELLKSEVAQLHPQQLTVTESPGMRQENHPYSTSRELGATSCQRKVHEFTSNPHSPCFHLSAALGRFLGAVFSAEADAVLRSRLYSVSQGDLLFSCYFLC